MSNFRDQIVESLRAIEILSPTQFSWIGKPSEPLPEHVLSTIDTSAARSYLRYSIQMRLYESFYCRGIPRRAGWDRVDVRVPGLTTYMTDALIAANHSKPYVEPGWTVTEVDVQRDSRVSEVIDGQTQVRVKRGGLTLRAQPNECVKPGGGELQPGDSIGLCFGKEHPAVSPAFYNAVGNRDIDWSRRATLVRFYFNIRPDGGPPLMDILTRHLNDAEIPFQFKVIRDPMIVARRDAAVLYVEKDRYEDTLNVLREPIAAHCKNLRPGVPALTFQLAESIAIAEQPTNLTESYGQQRCKLVAEGVLDAHDKGLTDASDKLRAVEEKFKAAGLDLDCPYLESGSEDIYAPIPEWNGASDQPAAESTTQSDAEPLDDTKLLDAAREIGEHLIERAFWHDGRCNWITPEDGVGPYGAPEYRLRNLESDVYSGTSGIGLFLAELYAATQDSRFADTARGALTSAMNRLGECDTIGLHIGTLGTSYATIRAARLLGDTTLEATARRSIDEFSVADIGEQEFDILRGHAGAILALLSLRNTLGDDRCLERAEQLAELILDGAERVDDRCWWHSPGNPRPHGLTGYCRGASGMAHALLELYEFTGDERLLDTAKAAFEYEQTWFRPERGNWADLREATDKFTPTMFGTHWCHGAPGIAFVRARAFEITGDERYREHAQVALNTTRRHIETDLRDGTGNFSICHGMLGNAEILVETSRRLRSSNDDSALMQSIRQAGIHRHLGTGVEWTCGVTSGEAPGLMRGIAGIGLAYIRAFRPEAESILFVLPGSNPNA